MFFIAYPVCNTETRRRSRVLRRIPKSGEYIPVTSTNGVKSGFMSVNENKDHKISVCTMLAIILRQSFKFYFVLMIYVDLFIAYTLL